MQGQRTEGPRRTSGHVTPRRRVVVDHDALALAARLTGAAWHTFLNAIAHLALAGELTVGERDAGAWVADVLERWFAALDDDETVRQLAEELRAEAAAVWERMLDGRARLRAHDRRAA